MSDFFIPGHTYRHRLEDGTPSDEGQFLVTYVGTAPEPYEYHAETLGVAFGWRRGLSPNGVIEGLGSYTTPDFAGWVEVKPGTEPNRIDWCEVCGEHSSAWCPGCAGCACANGCGPGCPEQRR